MSVSEVDYAVATESMRSARRRFKKLHWVLLLLIVLAHLVLCTSLAASIVQDLTRDLPEYPGSVLQYPKISNILLFYLRIVPRKLVLLTIIATPFLFLAARASRQKLLIRLAISLATCSSFVIICILRWMLGFG